MTAPKETPKETPPKDTPRLTAGDLRTMIREEITNIADKLIPGKSTQDSSSGTGSKSTVDSGQPVDVKSEVAAALQQLKAREDRQKRDERVDKMLAEYEKPKEETPPVERRRVEKLMRWGD